MARFAYLFSQFPALSTTFIQQQVAGTQRFGLAPLLIATRPPEESGYHPDDKNFIRQTLYFSRLSWRHYLKANCTAVMRTPERYARGIKLALKLGDNFRWQRLRNLLHLAGAAVLADYCIQKSVVHVHVHFAFGAAGIAIFLRILTDIPYSLSVHGSDVLLPHPLIEEKVKRAKFVVSNCQFLVRNLRHQFPSLFEQRFYVVPGGVDTQAGLWSKPRRILPDKHLRILSVGRLVSVKAQDILIKACARLRKQNIEFRCRIVGDGPKRKALEALIKRLKLGDAIKLTGICYQDEVSRLYDWSHVVVLSSISEGTPMTVIEAMAKARSVIAPKITGLPEMVLDGKTGFLFEKGSCEDLANTLARLAENPALMDKMGAAGRKRAETYFDSAHNARRLMDVFSREVKSLKLDYQMEIESD